MAQRSFFFVRSVAFGVISKASGALVSIVSLPVLAAHLPLNDWAWFLSALSITSLMLIPTGAAGGIFSAELARTLARSEPTQSIVGYSQGHFVILSSLALLAGMGLFHYSGEIDRGGLLSLLVLALTGSTAILSWSEHYRVGRRDDYVSSIVQTITNFSMGTLLLTFGTRHILLATVIYFGGIALHYSALTFLTVREEPFHPKLNVDYAISRTIASFPLIVNSAVEYFKIYGAGMLVSGLSGVQNYASYVTVTLIVARVVNPISLIARPLAPAVADARARYDFVWQHRLSSIFLWIVFGSAIFAITAILTVPLSLYTSILPPFIVNFSVLQIAAVYFLLWGGVVGSLAASIMLGQARTRVVAMSNVIWTVVGVVSGTIGIYIGIDHSMLIATGVCAMLSAICVSTFAIFILRGASKVHA